MENDYSDRWITASANGLRIRWYYFPFGTKLIRYDAIRSIRRVNMGLLTGRARIWGTASPAYWAHLDPARATRSSAYVIESRGPVKAFLTPADPAGFEAALRSYCAVPIADDGRGVIV